MKVLFIAPIDEFGLKDTGYGTAAAGIAHVLKKMMKETNNVDKTTFINIAKFKEAVIPKEQHDVAILVTNPHGLVGRNSIIPKLKAFLDKANKKYLSIVWETVPLPSQWKEIWDNNIFDGFLTPSYFVGAQVMKVTNKPVYYYPHYIHDEEIPQVDIDKKVESETEFTLLYMGQHTKRKGMEDAVIAFIRTLGYQRDASLVLKYHVMTPREMDPVSLIRHAVLCNTTHDRPKARIYSVTAMLTRDQLCRLFSNSSALIFPSYAEGFGLPPVESMCAGIPVIYTNWSSLPEVCGGGKGNIGVSYVLDEAHSMLHHGYMTDSVYAVPSMSDLMSAVRVCYNAWKKDKRLYYSQSSGNRDIIKKRFGYNTVSKCIKNIFSGSGTFLPQDITADWLPIEAGRSRAVEEVKDEQE